jgi:hypothetical protein
VITWIIEHGYWIGSGLLVLVLFLVIFQIVGWITDKYEDDDFEPIGEVPPPPPRTSPFARDRHRR